MWIFTQFGFYSVTQTPDRKDLIQIRARSKKHLENLKKAFPILDRSPVIVTPDADYRFRVVCKRWRWEKLAQELTANIDYSNFKGKVHQAGWARDMLDQLHHVWEIMHRFQDRLHPRRDPEAGTPVLFKDAKDRTDLFDESDEPGVEPATADKGE